MTDDEVPRLRRENHALQAKIQGLQYENQMYRQLLDNLFLRQKRSSSVVNEEHQGHIVEDFTQPGTEIFNIAKNFEDCDLDYEEEEAEEENRKKMARELLEEEKEPKVENPQVIKEEMERLFGTKGASEILAMETAMQLNFEKMRDKYNAELWPCIPLNMKRE